MIEEYVSTGKSNLPLLWNSGILNTMSKLSKFDDKHGIIGNRDPKNSDAPANSLVQYASGYFNADFGAEVFTKALGDSNINVLSMNRINKQAIVTVEIISSFSSTEATIKIPHGVYTNG